MISRIIMYYVHNLISNICQSFCGKHVYTQYINIIQPFDPILRRSDLKRRDKPQETFGCRKVYNRLLLDTDQKRLAVKIFSCVILVFLDGDMSYLTLFQPQHATFDIEHHSK